MKTEKLIGGSQIGNGIPFLHNHRRPFSQPTSISFARNTPPSEDIDILVNTYEHVSRSEIEKMADTLLFLDNLEIKLSELDSLRDIQKIEGRHHFEAGPMVHLLSASILPHEDGNVNKPLAIYGRIYIQFYHIYTGCTMIHHLFNRGFDDPEILTSTHYLTLISPDNHCVPYDLCFPIHETKIVVDLWDAHQKVEFARDSFSFKDVSVDEFEQVNLKVICGKNGSLHVRYFSMLFAIPCFVYVEFYHRENENSGRVLNVCGEIVARYGNTYGNYGDEECTLFRKLSHESEQVVLDKPNWLRLSRYWLSLPAYSSLIVDLDLYEFDTKTPIFKGVVEWLPQSYECAEAFAIDDFVMRVAALWYPREPQRCRLVSEDEEEIEEDEDEEEEKDEVEDEDEEEDEDEREEEEENETNIPWFYHPSVRKLYRYPAVEVFSVFIGGKKILKSLRLFGTIEVSSWNRSFYIYRRDEEDAFELSENTRFLPILDGTRAISGSFPLQIKLDLKDVDANIFIKGFIEWHLRPLNRRPLWQDNQLCSVIQGNNGFAAVQYSVFERAYQASLEVSYKLKKDGGSYGVYGSLVAKYDTYDYSTRFQRECYRIVLFERAEQDMLRLGFHGKLPLSRSTIVVPADKSGLIIEANVKMIDLLSGVVGQESSHVEIKPGTDSATMETQDCVIEFFFKWTEN